MHTHTWINSARPRPVIAAVALTIAPLIAWAQEAAQPATPAVAALTPSTAQATSRPARPAGGIGYEKTVPVIESGKWSGKRLPDGQPDIAGDWSNTIGNHNNFTDPQGGIPNDPQAARSGNRRPLGPREDRAPSRVSDPPDGQLPYLPWARAEQQALQHAFFDQTKPEDVEPLSRCAPAGIPMSFYWHGYEIRQYPGYVLFLFNSGWRIIHLVDPNHLPANIKLWQGDSRGHWEGNTLVVDVSNLNSKARFGRTGEFTTPNVHVVEKFIFDPDDQRYNYVATFTDPDAFSRPFTVTIPAKRWTVDSPPNGWHYEVPLANTADGRKIPDHFERICVENNGGFGQGEAKAATASTASPGSNVAGK